MRTLTAVPWSPLGSGPWRAPEHPRLSALPAGAEFVVIGAGVTGLRCAAALAEAGGDVVVLDRAFGCGAACRSGGIIVGDTLVGPAEGFDGCEEELRAWVDRHPLDGGFRWSGCMELGRDGSLSPDPIDWRDAGIVRRSGVVAGGTLDPSALVARLAAHAVACGARLADGVNVTGVIADGPSLRIAIDGGARSMTARRVLVASDACAIAAPFNPWPVRLMTVSLETPPLGDDRCDAMGWRDRQPFYTNDLPLLWGRALPSGGLLAGRELLSTEGPDARDLATAIGEAGDRLLRRLRALHPALADVDAVRVWAGPIARDDRGVPGLHADPDVPHVLWAGGYGGHGLAPAFRLGARAARRMLHEADAPIDDE